MRLLIKLLSISLATMLVPFYSQAAELNMPGFSGSVNSTITSGFTLRAEDNDCKGLPGYTAQMNANTVGAAALGRLGAGLSAAGTALGTGMAAKLTNFTSKNGAGCATSETDGYGNTSYNPLRIGNQNSDDGKMNFPNSGDVIDATQKMFTEISGYTDSGTGINLSFIGSVNPVLDINAEDFVRLTSKAKSQFESDITLLDAYMTHSIDTPGGGYVDLSFGRLATSFGEATFLPIGMNGLVTSGLDLTKLRAPGASIRDAIIPTEQIVAAFQAGDWGVEAYYQFGHDPVQLDPKGAFYGSDLAGTGAKNLLASGGWYEGDLGGDMACSYSYNVIELANSANGADLAALQSQCNAASLAKHTDTATRGLYSTTNLARLAQIGSTATDWATFATVGSTSVYRSAIQAGAGNNAFPGYDSTGLMSKYTSTPAGTALTLAANVYTDANLQQTDFNTGATVALKLADTKFKDPDGQDYGFSAHTYLDDLGSGVDIGVYYANYTSKVPYAQIIGKGGVLAGDHVGMYKTQFADYAGATGLDGTTAGHACGADIVGKTRVTSTTVSNNTLIAGRNLGANCAAWLALANGAYGSGVAGGFTAISGAFDVLRKDNGNNTAAANSQTNFIAKNFISQSIYGNVIAQANGREKVFHSPVGAVSGAATLYKGAGSGFAATTDLAFLSYGATLLPAITPLNLAEVQFVYPEDNQLIGASFNTNVNGTTVQGEVSYRPDFKLGTGVGDQVNQISDAAGSSLALTLFAIESGQTTMHDAVMYQRLEGVVNTVTGSATGMNDLVQNIQRSSLPDISALSTAANQADYRSNAWIEYDTWSFDLGTTTSFSPSSEVVQSLGADSAFLLTELGAVYINGMDNKKNGFVARNGFNEGSGEFLCLGIYQDLTDAQRTAISTSMKGFGYTNFNIDYNLMDVSTYNKLATTNTSHSRSGVNLAATTPLQQGDVINSTGAVIGASGSGTNDFNKVTNIASATNLGASIVDAIFGNGNYCERQMGADELSMTYRIIGGATYNNINNSRWSLSPNFAWAHDFYGYGPSSLGGFVPGKQSLSLGVNLDKGDGLRVGFNYVAQLGELTENTGTDRDYVSANVSYAF